MDMRELIRNTPLGDLTMATAEWWLAEQKVHSLRQRIDARQHSDPAFDCMNAPSFGPELRLSQLSMSSARAAETNVRYPMQEDVRASRNAEHICWLYTYLHNGLPASNETNDTMLSNVTEQSQPIDANKASEQAMISHEPENDNSPIVVCMSAANRTLANRNRSTLTRWLGWTSISLSAGNS